MLDKDPIFLKLLQPVNAPSLIDVTDDGIFIFLKLSHSANVRIPIVVMFSGKDTYSNDLQLENMTSDIDADAIMCCAEQVRDEAQFAGFVNGFNFARAILNGDITEN